MILRGESFLSAADSTPTGFSGHSLPQRFRIIVVSVPDTSA